MQDIIKKLKGLTLAKKIEWKNRDKFTKYVDLTDKKNPLDQFVVSITYNVATHSSIKNVIISFTTPEKTIVFDDLFPVGDEYDELCELWNTIKLGLAKDNVEIIKNRINKHFPK